MTSVAPYRQDILLGEPITIATIATVAKVAGPVIAGIRSIFGGSKSSGAGGGFGMSWEYHYRQELELFERGLANNTFERSVWTAQEKAARLRSDLELKQKELRYLTGNPTFCGGDTFSCQFNSTPVYFEGSPMPKVAQFTGGWYLPDVIKRRAEDIKRLTYQIDGLNYAFRDVVELANSARGFAVDFTGTSRFFQLGMITAREAGKLVPTSVDAVIERGSLTPVVPTTQADGTVRTSSDVTSGSGLVERIAEQRADQTATKNTAASVAIGIGILLLAAVVFIIIRQKRQNRR